MSPGTETPEPATGGAATARPAAPAVTVTFTDDDPDPTGRGPRCGATDQVSDYWLAPHPGLPHVAGDGARVRAVWW